MDVEDLQRLIIECVNSCLKTFGPSEGKNSLNINWLNLDELVEYLPDKPSKATIYTLTAGFKIPFHKRGKRLYFSKNEIDAWLAEAKVRTIVERKAESSIAMPKQ